jgi:hypothetical protein
MLRSERSMSRKKKFNVSSQFHTRIRWPCMKSNGRTKQTRFFILLFINTVLHIRFRTSTSFKVNIHQSTSLPRWQLHDLEHSSSDINSPSPQTLRCVHNRRRAPSNARINIWPSKTPATSRSFITYSYAHHDKQATTHQPPSTHLRSR